MQAFPAVVFYSIEEFRNGIHPQAKEYQRWREIEAAAIKDKPQFTFRGICYCCNRPADFMVDLLYSSGEMVNGKPVPNWRERLICEFCQLNNRIRASVHFLESSCQASRGARIYITEQSTTLFSTLQPRFDHLTGSEFFGDRIPYGSIDKATGFRNENVAKLSFGEQSLDYILTFDVLEHVPDYSKALAEFYRVLAPGGCLVFTVPFALGHETNIVRAYEDDDGKIVHLMEPEYHGDPISSQGCLCFRIFGWEMLGELKALGFTDVKANYYWSDTFAYLGEHQVIFSARKG